MSDGPDQLKLPFPANAKQQESNPVHSQPPSSLKQASSANQAVKQTHNQPDSTKGDTIEEPTMTNQTKPSDFESMLSELEKVVAQLEGEVKLEEALCLFERGMGLSRECEKFLEAAQQKIEVLKRSSGGDISTAAYADESEALV